MAETKTFPKYSYLKIESGEDYTLQYDNLADAVHEDEPTEVATYKLVSIKTYKKTVTVSEKIDEVED